MPRERRTWLGLGGIAVAFAALELWTATVEPYGLFHDELYYWACALHPSLGYVDHPPLSGWVLALAIALLGDGPLVFALVPALCGAGVVLLTGHMAGQLGAGSFGQLLAGLAAAVSPIFLVFASFYSVNAIELLLWTAGLSVLVEILRGGDERLWLAFGLIAGLGLLDKHTFLLIGFGAGVGIVLTPQRSLLRSHWPWLGAVLAFVIAFPNLYWNATNDWPSLAFYSSRGEALLDATLGEALLIQVGGMNAANVLLWVPGVAFLLFATAGRRLRALGIAFALLFVIVLVFGQRRGDRIAGVYPIALAAGAACWDSWQPRWRRSLRAALVTLLLLVAAAGLPMTLPMIAPPGVAAYLEAIGGKPEIEVADVGASMPLLLSGRLDWERFAREVREAWLTLSAEERARSAILTSHWVYASVIAYYGRNDEMPPVVAPHNAYAFWTGEAAGRDVVVSVAVDEDLLGSHFASTERIGHFACEFCTAHRPDRDIHVSRGPRQPLEALLDSWRYFGIGGAPKLLGPGPRGANAGHRTPSADAVSNR